MKKKRHKHVCCLFISCSRGCLLILEQRFMVCRSASRPPFNHRSRVFSCCSRDFYLYSCKKNKKYSGGVDSKCPIWEACFEQNKKKTFPRGPSLKGTRFLLLLLIKRGVPVKAQVRSAAQLHTHTHTRARTQRKTPGFFYVLGIKAHQQTNKQTKVVTEMLW